MSKAANATNFNHANEEAFKANFLSALEKAGVSGSYSYTGVDGTLHTVDVASPLLAGMIAQVTGTPVVRVPERVPVKPVSIEEFLAATQDTENPFEKTGMTDEEAQALVNECYSGYEEIWAELRNLQKEGTLEKCYVTDEGKVGLVSNKFNPAFMEEDGKVVNYLGVPAGKGFCARIPSCIWNKYFGYLGAKAKVSKLRKKFLNLADNKALKDEYNKKKAAVPASLANANWWNTESKQYAEFSQFLESLYDTMEAAGGEFAEIRTLVNSVSGEYHMSQEKFAILMDKVGMTYPSFQKISANEIKEWLRMMTPTKYALAFHMVAYKEDQLLSKISEILRKESPSGKIQLDRDRWLAAFQERVDKTSVEEALLTLTGEDLRILQQMMVVERLHNHMGIQNEKASTARGEYATCWDNLDDMRGGFVGTFLSLPITVVKEVNGKSIKKEYTAETVFWTMLGTAARNGIIEDNPDSPDYQGLDDLFGFSNESLWGDKVTGAWKAFVEKLEDPDRKERFAEFTEKKANLVKNMEENREISDFIGRFGILSPFHDTESLLVDSDGVTYKSQAAMIEAHKLGVRGGAKLELGAAFSKAQEEQLIADRKRLFSNRAGFQVINGANLIQDQDKNRGFYRESLALAISAFVQRMNNEPEFRSVLAATDGYALTAGQIAPYHQDSIYEIGRAMLMNGLWILPNGNTAEVVVDNQ